MKLYNTLTRTIEEIVPQQGKKLTVYTCGPTVYDYPHVGNWFTFVRYDMLIRALQAEGYDTDWVMNITDVGHLVSDADEGEDKLEKGAKREGKTAWDVAAFYADYFIQGMQRLHMLSPTYLPKATDHIHEQIDLIQNLQDKGFTYVISDGVYFDTSKFPAYANFAGLDLEEQQAGARVEFNPEKKNPTDFALWKFSPTDHQRDMEWWAPWQRPDSTSGEQHLIGESRDPHHTNKANSDGKQTHVSGSWGFPGWHVECSAMSMKYLGQTIDIHSGGIDHIPVHHTNEIAQSEAATGQQFARYWMHTNHVSVEGSKISKSLGNGITLEAIESRGFDMEDLRIHILESHYRSQSKFSWDSLEAAHNRLNDLYALAALRYQAVPILHDHSTFIFSDVPLELQRALSEDLHTEAALAYLSEVTKVTLAVLVAAEELDEFTAMLTAIDKLLGTNLLSVADISAAQKHLITEREQARTARDWQRSDTIRDQLAAEGIGIRDTSVGSIWFPLRRLQPRQSA